MTDPTPAPTSSVSSTQVMKSVPTLEDRVVVLEEQLVAMRTDVAKSQISDARLTALENAVKSVSGPPRIV